MLYHSQVRSSDGGVPARSWSIETGLPAFCTEKNCLVELVITPLGLGFKHDAASSGQVRGIGRRHVMVTKAPYDPTPVGEMKTYMISNPSSNM